ncbi:MAG TPA: efflux RND transporter periplasmic adaptor subunit [Planctomycetota bacterium]|nr:efflux RND transporter periplasmic adaptor subunit [Planctomycetota bacterium]
MSTPKGGVFQVVKIVFLRLRFIFIFVVIGVVSWKWELIMNTVDKVTRPKQAADLVQGDYEWYCPMHPFIIRSDDKQKCPICGMPLSRRKRGEQVQLPAGVVGHVQLSPYRIKQGGVATEEIGYKTLIRELRTVGTIDYDERRANKITARFPGRADELFVNFAGVRIQKGDPLYKIYSPDLAATEEEYLLAIKGYEDQNTPEGAKGDAVDRARRLVDSSRQRMKLWGITDEQIHALEKAKKVETYVTVESPVSGIVTRKDITAGQQLMMGDSPYTVIDDASVWMQAEVFERDLSLIREGRMVEIATESYPGESFMGKVSFVGQQIDPATRTIRVRVDVDNSNLRLKQGMYVTALFRIPVAGFGEIFYGCCELCPDVHEDAPGKCKKCAMELVKKGGVRVDEGEGVDPSHHHHDSKEAPDTAPEGKKEGKAQSQPAPAPELKDLTPKTEPSKAEAKAKYVCSMDGASRETPGPCPKCKMALTEEDRVKAAGTKSEEKKAAPGPEASPAPTKEEPHVHEGKQSALPRADPNAKYQCSMDGATRETPGPCPKCKMVLTEEDRVKGSGGKPDEKKAATAPPIPSSPPQEAPHVHEKKMPESSKTEAKPEAAKPGDQAPQDFVYKCPMDGAVRDTPGPCPTCKMPLDDRHKVAKKTLQKERTIYVCDVHPEEVFDKPGQCFKESCNGMELEARKIVPGAKLLYVCPVHPEIKSDKPGVCPKDKCGKKLGFKVVSDATQLSETWACALHPDMTAGGKLQCPECGREMKHMEVEQVLAVPFSAVIDTGERKVVFVDKGHGTFDAVLVELGLRAGEYYPVLKGLAAGDRVVTAGAFLLDAETRLNPAAGVIYFGASGQEPKK